MFDMLEVLFIDSVGRFMLSLITEPELIDPDNVFNSHSSDPDSVNIDPESSEPEFANIDPESSDPEFAGIDPD